MGSVDTTWGFTRVISLKRCRMLPKSCTRNIMGHWDGQSSCPPFSFSDLCLCWHWTCASPVSVVKVGGKSLGKSYLIPSLNPFLVSFCWRLIPNLMVTKVFEVQISFLLDKSISKKWLHPVISSLQALLCKQGSSLGYDDHILTLIFVSTQNIHQKKLQKASLV